MLTVPLKISTTAGLVVDQFTQNSHQLQISERLAVASTRWENALGQVSAISCTLSPFLENWDATCIQDVAELNHVRVHLSDPEDHLLHKDAMEIIEMEATLEMGEEIIAEGEAEIGTARDAIKRSKYSCGLCDNFKGLFTIKHF